METRDFLCSENFQSIWGAVIEKASGHEYCFDFFSDENRIKLCDARN